MKFLIMHQFKTSSNSKGFTVIEIIIVIAVVGLLIAVVGLPFISFRKQQALQNTTNALTSLLNEARTKTLAAVGNTVYSVRTESDQAILFTGTTYNSNTPTNEVLSFETPVTASTSLQGGGNTISFDRLKGTTSQYGTITLTIPTNVTKTVTITATGTVLRN